MDMLLKLRRTELTTNWRARQSIHISESKSGFHVTNSPAMFIANVDDNATIANILGGQAPQAQRGGGAAASHASTYLIKVSAQQDGMFTVTNTRNGFSKTRKPRP